MTTGTIRERVKVGEEPEGVTVRPDGREVYVTCEGDNEVVAVDTATLKVVGRMKTGARPRSVVFTKDGATAFVTDENAATVTVIDTAKHTVAKSIVIPKTQKGPTPPRPMGAVLSPDGKAGVRVARPGARDCGHRRRASARGPRRSKTSATRPWGIEVSADGTKVYTANGPSADVSIVDLADRHRRAPDRHRRQPVGAGDQVSRLWALRAPGFWENPSDHNTRLRAYQASPDPGA